MAVKRGYIYSCPFGNNKFTSQEGDEFVVVLSAKFGKSDKECLVARVQEAGLEWKADIDHVYTVVSSTLKEYRPPLTESQINDAKKALMKQIEKPI
jgi:uncharacterized protein YpuA (DUF1002 family)